MRDCRAGNAPHHAEAFAVAQSDDPGRLEVEVRRSSSDTPLVPAAFRDLAVLELKPAPRRFRARALMPVVVVLLVAGAAFYGRYYWTVGRFLESTDDAYVQADSTIVAPKVSGYLRDVQVSDNQPVKAGQLLATIDDRDYVVALDQAKADVAPAQADVENLKASLDQQQAVIAQAHDTVNLDQSNLTYAQQENDRYAILAKRGAGSVELAQQAISRLDSARGISDPAAAQQKAFVALGEIIRKQAMIMGYSDTFAVLGGLLLLAAALVLLTRRGEASGAGAH
jgi:multidrug resistance efflux pump